MRLDDILTQRAVRHVGKPTSKKRLFLELGQAADEVWGLDAEATYEALQDRESLGPTGVGAGVALPHARLPGLERVRGLFLRLDTPLEFAAVDRKPVDLVFALFAPEGAGVEHLKALALVSRTLRDQSLLAKLRANGDPAVLYTLLTEDRAQAA